MACIHLLIEAQASSQPEATAISFEDNHGSRRSMTYGELYKAARAVGALLRKLG